MFVTVTTADTAGEPIENAAVVAEEMERWLRETDGFEGFLLSVAGVRIEEVVDYEVAYARFRPGLIAAGGT